MGGGAGGVGLRLRLGQRECRYCWRGGWRGGAVSASEGIGVGGYGRGGFVSIGVVGV